MKTCSVVHCDRNPSAKGFCKKHHQRFMRGKNPHEKTWFELTPGERFLSKFEKCGEDDCWEWTAKWRAEGGYGKLGLNGGEVRAHRFSYEHYVGPIPEGLFVLHHCDNPPCVNPKHLYVGTFTDNRRDCVRRGRDKSQGPKGESSSFSKLTNGDTLRIRELINDGARVKDVAISFDVCRQSVTNITSGRTWSHL